MDEPAPTGEMERNGWTRRFIASEPRLSEAVEMYREAGTEISEMKDASSEKCQECFKGFEDQYKIIYTRPGRTAAL
jgi:hypothetical protein